MKSISLKLTEELDAKLTVAAQQGQTTKSEVVRKALDTFLNGSNRPLRGSFLDLAGDLIGCAEGPEDLSHNPEHFQGFGQ